MYLQISVLKKLIKRVALSLYSYVILMLIYHIGNYDCMASAYVSSSQSFCSSVHETSLKYKSSHQSNL